MGRPKIHYLQRDATPNVQPFIHPLPYEMPIGPLLDYTIIFNRLYKHVDDHSSDQPALPDSPGTPGDTVRNPQALHRGIATARWHTDVRGLGRAALPSDEQSPVGLPVQSEPADDS